VVVNLKRRQVKIPVSAPDSLISIFFAVSPSEYSNDSRPSNASLGFHSCVVLDSVVLKYDVASQGYWFPTFPRSGVPWWGFAVAQLVGVLRYKPEGRRFDSRWCHGIFLLVE
jgi:hypothetical protein